MAALNFPKALSLVLLSEGGYSNDPVDGGGATNHGITQRVYTAYQTSQGLRSAPHSVKIITDSEVAAIYKEQYWDAIRGDDLPAGIDYCVFDEAVNSGVVRAAQSLQRNVGTNVDGHIGLMTLSAVANAKPATLIRAYGAERLSFLKKLSNWWRFGKGWASRVAFVQNQALKMAGAV